LTNEIFSGIFPTKSEVIPYSSFQSSREILKGTVSRDGFDF
jgi:hypothetical protein